MNLLLSSLCAVKTGSEDCLIVEESELMGSVAAINFRKAAVNDSSTLHHSIL